MNPAKATALLNGRVQTYYQGFGGEKVTETDIAFAYGMMWDEGARLYGRVKWAGHMAFVEPLFGELRKRMSRLDWQADPEELDRVCLLALVEGIYPHLCPTCNGHGHIMIEKRKVGRPRKRKSPQAALKVVCQDCKGEGTKPYSERSLSKIAGIKRWRWEKFWSKRYRDDVVPLIQRYERIFWRGLRRILS